MAKKPIWGETNILKSASIMGLATFISRVMGLVRELVFAVYFGAGNFTDAFHVAFRIPNLLRDLFAEGAMSASLVPTFTQVQVEEGEQRAWRVAGLVFRILFFLVGGLAFFGILFAPQLVSFYASAFKQIPGKFELTVQMTRIMFPFFPCVALAAAFMGILNACGIFFIPAFSSALFNITSIGVGVVCVQIFSGWGSDWKIQPIVGMAFGVLVGGGVQAFCQLPFLYQVGYRWVSKKSGDPSWFEDPSLRKILGMMIPGTIGLAATQVNLLVNTILATSQGPGAVSWLNYAFRLMQFPIGIFGVSLASATLTQISQQLARKDIQGVSQTLTQSLRSVFAVNLPAASALIFLGFPIIELIFQYGRFYPEDAQATARALAMYAVGLVSYSMVKVLVPVCYALGNTKLPVLSSFLTVGLTIGLNLVMSKTLGYWGLALGTSIAALFNGCFLMGVVRSLIFKQGGQFPLSPIFKGLLGYLSVALFMGTLCYYSEVFLRIQLSDQMFFLRIGRMGTVLARSIRMILLVFEGVLVFLMVSKIFRLQEASYFTNIFVKKMKNKLRRSST